MRMTQILVPAAVRTRAPASREETVAQLVSALAQARGLDADASLKAIAARERLGPTLFPAGPYYVAVPHAFCETAKQLSIGLALAREGIAWPAADKRANVILVLLGPPQTQSLYLRVLSRIATLCQMEGFLDAWLACETPQQVIEATAQAEASLGEIPEAKGMPTFCVVGAGHGGMAMAGHLTMMGCRVNLLNRDPDRILSVQARGGIDVTGELEGFAALNRITSDTAEALQEVDIVMVVVPATAHGGIAEMLAPHLRDGQIVILNPGRTGGALEVSRILRERNPSAHLYIGEAQTLLYAARVTNPGQVRIFSIKNSVPVATLPAYHLADVLPVLRKALPQFVPGDNVLKTGLDNIGAVFHPAITVLNAGRIEDTHGDFEYYVEGVTPAVADILEALDRERVSVASALGIRANTAREWLYLAYSAVGKTLMDAMRANPGYRGIVAPETIQHRYISEDVPASLVPIASIGEMLGVPTPTIRAIIHLASIMHGVDYWKEGRTLERLGLQGMSVKDIQFLVVGAEAPARAAPPGPDLLYP
jgi:opine dehydrogenase